MTVCGGCSEGARSSATFQPWYRLAVGFWILLALFWIGGVIGSLKEALDYQNAIHEPLGETADGDTRPPQEDDVSYTDTSLYVSLTFPTCSRSNQPSYSLAITSYSQATSCL